MIEKIRVSIEHRRSNLSYAMVMLGPNLEARLPTKPYDDFYYSCIAKGVNLEEGHLDRHIAIPTLHQIVGEMIPEAVKKSGNSKYVGPGDTHIFLNCPRHSHKQASFILVEILRDWHGADGHQVRPLGFHQIPTQKVAEKYGVSFQLVPVL